MSADIQREAGQLEDVPLPEQGQQLVGHEAQFKALSQQLDQRRLPGGVLLHGPEGIGKATFAFYLAAKILEATGDEPIERIKEQIAAGAHPNVFVLRRRLRETGKGHYTVIRVEDVRKAQDKLHLTRGRAGYRICIVDSIDDCNINAANALLKVLEEPPVETIFLLVSHRPGSLLPTIRSRCHAYALRTMSDDDVRAVVSPIFADTTPAKIDHAIELAAGRPRRACEALALEGLETLEKLRAWLENPDTSATIAHLDLAEAIAGAGDAEAAFARDLLIDWLAAEARAAVGASSRLASATQLWDKAHELFASADIYNLDKKQTLVTIFDAIKTHVRSHISRAPNELS